ncbi:TPA: hypothetical protein MHZ75_27735, partial [Klebsiella pneumoniae subsp. pneumoniae]|nr:hypothetical protein [Klebsiella pneumoniae subsp. pneumoniae]
WVKLQVQRSYSFKLMLIVRHRWPEKQLIDTIHCFIRFFTKCSDSSDVFPFKLDDIINASGTVKTVFYHQQMQFIQP